MTTTVNWPSFTKTWHKFSYPSISPTRPELSLTGKTVITTDGGDGIGAAIAKSVALAGASHLAIIGRRSALLSKTAADIKASTGTATDILPVTADLTKKEDVDKAIEQIHQEFRYRPLDVLITNAGFFTGPRPLGPETVEEWTNNFDVNVKAVYLITTAFLARTANDATIINISSGMAHLSPIPGASSYAATKLAGAKLIEYFAAENPRKRVVNVHPGQVGETDLSAKYFGDTGSETVYIDDVELAGDFTVWVASPEAAFLSGKFVWCNWDVDELKERKGELEGTSLLTTGLEGWSDFKYHA